MDKVRKVSLTATLVFSMFCMAAGADLAAAADETTKKTEESMPELPDVDKLIYGGVSYPDGANGESCSVNEPEQTASAAEAAPELPEVDRLLNDPDLSIKQSAVAKPGISAAAITVPNMPKAAPKAVSPIVQMKLMYKQGKYRDCLNIIEKVAQTELTHYYAGLCYQGQGQLSRATSEFQWVASYAKDPLVKYNAQMALQSVSSYARARTYAGQGNNFARVAGGGGGPIRRG